MSIKVGEKAPNIQVSKWVQGLPTNFDKEKDHIVLVEVFQVNCPGCFLYGIPEAINIYNKYHSEGVTVLGIATAFEDFDKNTLENLELLLKSGEVIGETKKGLSQYGKLNDSKLSYKIPFPVAMDSLIKETGESSESRIKNYI
ncbi:MAG: TlpA family protein disulfide reductase, partial [Thaumarchaeota archaeon]|nr:TlpA family protein disulfide reductase [Nitrososphaerota archaeon]